MLAHHSPSPLQACVSPLVCIIMLLYFYASRLICDLLGLGVALSVPLYHTFIDTTSIRFTDFMLFTAVVFSITAFPVLCRILTELKLLDTTVGIVVLSAGVGNDIVGWILLALCITLINAHSGLTALWITFICVGWTIFFLLPVKWAMLWLARRTGSTHGGPTIFFVTVTILVAFASAFFTDVIGVCPTLLGIALLNTIC